MDGLDNTLEIERRLNQEFKKKDSLIDSVLGLKKELGKVWFFIYIVMAIFGIIFVLFIITNVRI